MTKQETFDTVCSALLAQGKAALTENRTKCRYRGAGGTKCAAGVLIPDDRYQEAWEGPDLTTNTPLKALLCDELGHDFDLVLALQCAHDTSPIEDSLFVGYFKERATKIARQFGLKTEVLGLSVDLPE